MPALAVRESAVTGVPTLVTALWRTAKNGVRRRSTGNIPGGYRVNSRHARAGFGHASNVTPSARSRGNVAGSSLAK